jgi:spore maturation protein CgeB
VTLRILFLGENWFGSCARACCHALRRLGCEVADFDAQTIFPQLRRRSLRAVLRVAERQLIREYNQQVLGLADTFKPDIVLAFKGAYVLPNTLLTIKQAGSVLYNYFPDTSAFAHGSLLPKTLPLYDCLFLTKRFLDRDLRAHIKLRESVFLPHGYDPELHQPWELDERDRTRYGHDVGVVATHTRAKEELLTELVTLRPDLDLRIWGNLWNENSRSHKLRRFIEGAPLNGTSYAKALGTLRINLAVMSGAVPGASRGDETTTRTYEIPACGGFMLHERTDEVLELFAEGKEMACFGSAEDLADKIDYYLAHPEERAAIAAAGRMRCVPAYSYDNRMAEIIRWHEEHSASEADRLSA